MRERAQATEETSNNCRIVVNFSGKRSAVLTTSGSLRNREYGIPYSRFFIEKRLIIEVLMGNILVTNNPMVCEKFANLVEMIYDENFSYLDVLIYVRNRIHANHELLTHPLSGSIKPNETPYKSIMISPQKKDMHFESLSIIEDSIAAYRKFAANRPTPVWTEKILKDFQLIDYDIIHDSVLR